MAIEQAEIAIGHLKVLETQWRYIPQVAALELRYLVDLADALLAATDDPAEEVVRGRDSARLVDHADFGAMRSVTQSLGLAIERLIEEAGGLLSNEGARTAILEHARHQARLERSWFAASGLSNTTDAPALEALLAGK
ncbi:hypothetical protein [Brevundimonas sp. SH203]|uniref:hypothetical protein n=1 Tax=Brevundimonas sp. SH203 TaxID=345167 RepID=UPI001178B83E|nr:hypothetical protein [Brevundimonas sp. SH203]